MHHRRDVLDTLVADMKAAAPDHIVVSGDLVNVSLADEFVSAADWLESLGKPADITLVPGNHDAYVPAAAHAAERAWAAYMKSEAQRPVPAGAFPFVRRRGPIALIGVSTAIPTGPFSACGRLGAGQLHRLATILADIRREPLFRVLAIHHPPVSTTKEHHKRLIDAGDLLELLRTTGVDLVIHGHEHLHALVWIDGPAGRIPVVGVPSASASASDACPAGYNLYRIDGEHNAWRCEIISRGLAPDGRGMMEVARRSLIAAD
jgi:3',5'-cyclic AMP phosphodiesterase CpdA